MLTVILLVPFTITADEMDKELENLILSVKERIDVPKECTEFNYNVQSGEEGDIYFFHWMTKDNDSINIYVSVEKDGNIINYSGNNYTYRGEQSFLAKVSYEKGLENAKDFITKIEAPYKDELRLSEQANITQGTEYDYVFDHYVNGIKVKDRKVEVFVNKQTGEVIEFRGPRTYKGTYGNSQAKLSLDAAKKAYIEKIEIPLVYRLYYDYEKESTRSFPAYIVYNTSNKAIDAITGEVITPYSDNSHMWEASKSAEAGDVAMGKGELSPQEQKAVDETQLLLSKYEAKQKAQQYFPRIKESKIQDATLTKRGNEQQYVWELYLLNENPHQTIYLSINAMTGEILSYRCYVDYLNEGKNVNEEVKEEVIKEKVESFLKNIAKEKYPLTRYNNGNQEMVITASEEETYSIYEYERLVNGISVMGDGLTVVYDKQLDEITVYYNVWNDTNFKDIKGAVGEDKIADHIGLELMYIDKDKNHKVLAYAHDEQIMAFDPFTGNRISYYGGEPQYNTKQRTFYDDVKGHPKEAIIKKLFDSGIMLPGKSLRPDEDINQVDFLRLVLKDSRENASEEEIYQKAIYQGILSEDEKDPDRTITKEEAIKYIINGTAYKNVASLTEIYRYPYEDEQEVDEKLKGYVALAYGLGIIEKDKTNLLNPKDTLTRAQAMHMIYNLIK